MKRTELFQLFGHRGVLHLQIKIDTFIELKRSYQYNEMVIMQVFQY